MNKLAQFFLIFMIGALIILAIVINVTIDSQEGELDGNIDKIKSEIAINEDVSKLKESGKVESPLLLPTGKEFGSIEGAKMIKTSTAPFFKRDLKKPLLNTQEYKSLKQVNNTNESIQRKLELEQKIIDAGASPDQAIKAKNKDEQDF